MTAGITYRDVGPSDTPSACDARPGRAYIAVIGIDRYRTWNRLYNAVSDAKGARRLFAGFGFELIAPPLFDENATGDALRRLVVDDLFGPGEDDSLVLFFAGHGHTVTRSYGGTSVRDGYVIPVDGDRPAFLTSIPVTRYEVHAFLASIPVTRYEVHAFLASIPVAWHEIHAFLTSISKHIKSNNPPDGT